MKRISAPNCGWIREGRCKHDGTVSETQACDAICDKCGKNLGFIGAWRERHPKNSNMEKP